jgi:uncharacterized protein YbjT (DUF2867 family)
MLGAGGERMQRRVVFVSGATGFMGRGLILRLLERGHQVRGLVRAGSEGKLPEGCRPVRGNALDEASYADQVPPADTFVHLVGTAHPAPWKEREFRAVDLVSLKASVAAARSAGIRHFVYVSVAQPAPVMKAYLGVRAECERHLRSNGVEATILRPWYVLGPGRFWPLALLPFYWLAEQFAATRAGAQRLGLLWREEMIRALVWAVENPARGVRVLDVPAIRHVAKA